MEGVTVGELVTPRVPTLMLESATAPGTCYRVQHGVALRLAGCRADGQAEVEYLFDRWLVAEAALQPFRAVESRIVAPPLEVVRTAGAPPMETPIAMRRVEISAFLLLGAVVVALLVVGVWAVDAWSAGRAPPMAGSSMPAQSPASPRQPPQVTAVALSSPQLSSVPVVRELVVCDATVDCGLDPTQAEFAEVTACLRIESDAHHQVLLVITDRALPPGAGDDPIIVARSAVVAGSDAFTCYRVRAVRAPLGRREYWLWVLAEGVIVGQQHLTLAP
jgi:hypothetical protein